MYVSGNGGPSKRLFSGHNVRLGFRKSDQKLFYYDSTGGTLFSSNSDWTDVKSVYVSGVVGRFTVHDANDTLSFINKFSNIVYSVKLSSGERVQEFEQEGLTDIVVDSYEW